MFPNLQAESVSGLETSCCDPDHNGRLRGGDELAQRAGLNRAGASLSSFGVEDITEDSFVDDMKAASLKRAGTWVGGDKEGTPIKLKANKGSKQRSREQCKAKTKAGGVCQAPAVERGLCFFHAHPEKLAALGPPAIFSQCGSERLRRIGRQAFEAEVEATAATMDGNAARRQKDGESETWVSERC